MTPPCARRRSVRGRIRTRRCRHTTRRGTGGKRSSRQHTRRQSEPHVDDTALPRHEPAAVDPPHPAGRPYQRHRSDHGPKRPPTAPPCRPGESERSRRTSTATPVSTTMQRPIAVNPPGGRLCATTRTPGMTTRLKCTTAMKNQGRPSAQRVKRTAPGTPRQPGKARIFCTATYFAGHASPTASC